MARKWPPEMTRSLIACYEMQPILYKVDCPNYHNQLLRNKALRTIRDKLKSMHQIELTLEEIKKKINNLRTQFCENYKRYNKEAPITDDNETSESKPAWWLFEDLSFLLPHLKKDKGIANACLEKQTSPGNITTSHEDVDDSATYFEIPYSEGDFKNEPEEVFSENSENVSCASITPTNTVVRRKRARAEEEIKLVASAVINEDPPSKNFSHADLPSFVNYIAMELDKIKDAKLYKKCKRQILRMIEDTQDQDEDEF